MRARRHTFIQQMRRHAHSEKRISDHVPIIRLASPTLFETRQGDIGCVIQLSGCPFLLTDDDVLNERQQLMATFISQCDERIGFYFFTHRAKGVAYPKASYRQSFAKQFDAAYQKRFLARPLFQNTLYMVLISKPWAGTSFLLAGLSFLRGQDTKEQCRLFLEQRHEKIRLIQKKADELLEVLSDFSPKMVCDESASLGKTSALLRFLGVLINGSDRGGYRYPQTELGRYLPRAQLRFGHNAFEWIFPDGKIHYGAILSLKSYAMHSASVAFDPLLDVDFEYTNTHTFFPMTLSEALSLLKSKKAHMLASERSSEAQALSLDALKEALISGKTRLGHHHNTLVLRADSVQALEMNLSKAVKIFQQASLEAKRENLNLEAAFWSQLPGNQRYIARHAVVTVENITDYCPLHNHSAGFVDQNYLGSAAALIETMSKTPLYLNLHLRGREQEITLGHTTIIGPSGAGKTTLALFLDVMLKKYTCTSFFFDYQCAAEPYIRASGGRYIYLSGDRSTTLNPLQLPDTLQNRHYLADEWLPLLLIENETDSLGSLDKNLLKDIVDRVYQLPKKDRRLSVIFPWFPPEYVRRQNLLAWLHDESIGHGVYANYFNSASDELDLDYHGVTIGLDMTEILKRPPLLRTPVMSYLFYRIRLMLDGRLTGIFIDEAWQFLNDAFWKKQLDDYLATLRKSNAFMLFMTQQPETVAHSAVKDTIMNNLATQIWMPNSRAQQAVYCDVFRLSERELHFIRKMGTQSRQFLIKQAHDAAIGKLDLSQMPEYLTLFSTSLSDVALMHRCLKQHGDDWLNVFYQEKGVHQ